MTEKTYTIAALAAELGVPRTTINDWLTRYADFVESEMLGKRRVYSGRTLEVLRLAAALREAGQSAAEIERELAAHFGIRPEVAAAPEPEPTSEPVPEPMKEPIPESEPIQLPALRKLEENALELSAFLAEMRRKEARSARRTVLLSVILILLAAGLVLCGAVAWRIYTVEKAARQQEAAALQQTIRAMQETFAARLMDAKEAANAERAAAAKRHETLQKELEAVQSAREAEMAQQRVREAAFQKQMQEMQSKYESSLKAQNQNSEQMLREVKNHAEATEKRLQSEIAKARTEVEKLSGELAQKTAGQSANQPVQTEVPQPKPAVLTVHPEVQK